MDPRKRRSLTNLVCLIAGLLLPCSGYGQKVQGSLPSSTPNDSLSDVRASLIVMIRDPSGGPLDMALVSLNSSAGGMLAQATTIEGRAEFDNLIPGDYWVNVSAAGYDSVQQNLNIIYQGTFFFYTLRSTGSSSPYNSRPSVLPVLSPKAQKQLAKAMEALRAQKPENARGPLDQALRLAPGHPDVQYAFGVYYMETRDWSQAITHWEKALSIYPKHYGSLMFMGAALLVQKKPEEAVSYLNRAIEVAPSAWRPHAMLAQANLVQAHYDDAVHQAERAMELGHTQAASVKLLLADALVAQGNKERAITVLQQYLQEQPQDAAARRNLNALRGTLAPAAAPTKNVPAEPPARASFVSPSILPSSWMPPDVDERIPDVVPDVPCRLEEVLRGAGRRMTELVRNVDRFTATEQLTHERIDANGQPSTPEKRTFNYLVSIEELRPGNLDVEEFRGIGASLGDFPDEIATLGLPSMVLVFHPAYRSSFEFACEGLARGDTGAAWLVHFRQKPDASNTLLVYRTEKRTSAIALKGRAWIAADSFQVERLETDLVSPHPEIRLVGQHTDIAYAPVRFRTKDVSMWLPQYADVYMDWGGKRIHRRHGFSNFMLFSVDDKQKIGGPAAAPGSSPVGNGGGESRNPQSPPN